MSIFIAGYDPNWQARTPPPSLLTRPKFDDLRDEVEPGPFGVGNCARCGEAFSKRGIRQSYCSSTCQIQTSNDRRRKEPERTCRHCGASFKSRNAGRRTCSEACSAANRLAVDKRAVERRHERDRRLRQSIHPDVPQSSEWIHKGRTIRVTSVVPAHKGMRAVVRSATGPGRPWTVNVVELLASAQRVK